MALNMHHNLKPIMYYTIRIMTTPSYTVIEGKLRMMCIFLYYNNKKFGSIYVHHTCLWFYIIEVNIEYPKYIYEGVVIVWYSWIYNYLCNQCLSSLILWVRISIRARCTTLCDEVCQWLATGRWFSLVSSYLCTSYMFMILYHWGQYWVP
jgi:hypothetical protein